MTVAISGRMHSPTVVAFMLSVSILASINSYDAFRIDSKKSGVVFQDDVETTTAEAPTTPQVVPFEIPEEVATVANRTKMIVANEISNLPRFVPKPNTIRQLADFVPSAESSTLASPQIETDPDDVTTLQNVSSGQSSLYGDSCQFCPELRLMQHYFAKNCIAMELQTECKPKFCPKYFDCPKEKELPKDGCMYAGRKYRFGANVPHSDPCQHCLCVNSTNGPMMSCAISECFNSWTPLQPNCYRKFTPGECCPEIVCRPPNNTLPTCSFEGNVHSFGDYFSPENDPCQNCLCDERWNRSANSLLETSCTRVECHFEFERPENRGCVPVYGDKSCCPMYFHCPDQTKNPKCKFGSNLYEIGETIKVKQHEVCLECSCLVPPDITCKHKTCPMAPKNCTTVYVEGECCPQFKCSNAVEEHEEEKEELLHEENSMKDHSSEKIVQDEEVQCPPIDSCNDPCKLGFEDMGDTSEQSESAKCPTCKCESNLSPDVEHGNRNISASSAPCKESTKRPCPRPDDAQAQWSTCSPISLVKAKPSTHQIVVDLLQNWSPNDVPMLPASIRATFTK